MEKYRRENNQLKYIRGLQMNFFKDSSLSEEYADSCEAILLWFCPDNREKWLSADNYLLWYETKFEDEIIWFEKQDPFVRNGYFPCEISFHFKSYVWRRKFNISYNRVHSVRCKLLFFLFILTVMHQPFNYHATEISSFWSNCFKQSYI